MPKNSNIANKYKVTVLINCFGHRCAIGTMDSVPDYFHILKQEVMLVTLLVPLLSKLE